VADAGAGVGAGEEGVGDGVAIVVELVFTLDAFLDAVNAAAFFATSALTASVTGSLVSTEGSPFTNSSKSFCLLLANPNGLAMFDELKVAAGGKVLIKSLTITAALVTDKPTALSA